MCQYNAMNLDRTTVRLRPELKESAENIAHAEDITLQEIINRALDEYLTRRAKKRAKKIVFKVHDLGVPLDNLTRDDYYDDPRI